eukprot:CAMPEP_0170613742 /NCGR_PEP_ID=MMETSP0224-20130122/24435_1 /TAXON_ID=285029 /ORGANISM="Togula jolla, Strain CCCM 725" /LENGTH=139 /DNA_ID=CAMNT_0010939365 /DNA_START=416 /DNA_END=834 /DNA_ORIENTATION=+
MGRSGIRSLGQRARQEFCDSLNFRAWRSCSSVSQERGSTDGFATLQPAQEGLVVSRDPVQLTSVCLAVEALHLDTLVREHVAAQRRRLSVNAQHLLQEDAVLQLNLCSAVFLKFLALQLVAEVSHLLGRGVIHHSPRAL